MTALEMTISVSNRIWITILTKLYTYVGSPQVETKESLFLLSTVEELVSSGEEVKEKPSALQQTKGMYYIVVSKPPCRSLSYRHFSNVLGHANIRANPK